MYKARNDKVHQEWDNRIIPSSEGENRFYRVFIGTVLWSDDEFRKACVVFVQHGNTEGWHDAIAKREIKFNYPAHILVADYRRVTAAMKELIARYPDRT